MNDIDFANFIDQIKESTQELGGFAEEPEYVSDAIDKEEQLRDFEAFNYCLAEDYVGAMYHEEFAFIGEMSEYLLRNIIKWINYTEALGNQEDQRDVDKGTLITKYNRTIIEAIIANKNISFAHAYIAHGVYHPTLMALLIENDEPVIIYDVQEEEFKTIIEDLFQELENRYLASNDKNNYLKQIINGISRVTYPEALKIPPITKKLTWKSDLKKLRREEKD